MVVGQMLFAHYSAFGANPDPARLSAQVITGVGFLGAGTIMRKGTSVKGLTTAASLWSVACLGIAAGAGYYFVALVGMVLIFITLTLLEVVQNKLVGAHGDRCSYCLETNDVTVGLRVLHDCAKECRVEIGELLAEKSDDGVFSITFHAELGGARGAKRRQMLFEKLAAHSGIVSVYQKCDLSTPHK
jgi:putative Mg2+ transporter-C (MgtC) family protein